MSSGDPGDTWSQQVCSYELGYVEEMAYIKNIEGIRFEIIKSINIL